MAPLLVAGKLLTWVWAEYFLARPQNEPQKETMPTSPKITITQVAAEAGVSTATAGRVLGNYGYTSDDVAAKVVCDAMREAVFLGHLPERPAVQASRLQTGSPVNRQNSIDFWPNHM